MLNVVAEEISLIEARVSYLLWLHTRFYIQQKPLLLIVNTHVSTHNRSHMRLEPITCDYACHSAGKKFEGSDKVKHGFNND